MPTYVVESFLPRSRGRELDAMAGRARRAARDLSREGTPVSYVRSVFVSADELCFHFFEAETPRAAQDACTRSGLVVDRIAEATSSEPDREGRVR
jgi:hypothetical protein